MDHAETFRLDDFERRLLAARPDPGPRLEPPWSRLFDNVLVVQAVDSTQRLVRAIARDYLDESLEPPPLVLVAARQTAGRGRQGRSWASPAGAGVWATVLWNPRWQSGDGAAEGDLLALLPLRVAVALAQAVEDLTGRPCRVEWPNDLMMEGGKVGGILIEAMARGEGRLALIGFGVNHHFPGGEPPVDTATSIAAETAADDPTPGLWESFWRLLTGLAEELATVPEPQAVVEAFRRRSRHREGEPMTCRLGERELAGTFRGFDPRGFLQLEVDGRVETVAAGEVIEHGG